GAPGGGGPPFAARARPRAPAVERPAGTGRRRDDHEQPNPRALGGREGSVSADARAPPKKATTSATPELVTARPVARQLDRPDPRGSLRATGEGWARDCGRGGCPSPPPHPGRSARPPP